jgi:DNA-binding PadR family transcriptional regulator
VSDFLDGFDKAFENKVRLGAMAALMVNDALEFNRLKELLKVTDGNLASHLRTLEDNAYVTFEKEFSGRKPRTVYQATALGMAAFKKHLKAIEDLLK